MFIYVCLMKNVQGIGGIKMAPKVQGVGSIRMALKVQGEFRQHG
jgi:hypothetical protein